MDAWTDPPPCAKSEVVALPDIGRVGVHGRLMRAVEVPLGPKDERATEAVFVPVPGVDVCQQDGALWDDLVLVVYVRACLSAQAGGHDAAHA